MQELQREMAVARAQITSLQGEKALLETDLEESREVCLQVPITQ